MSKMLYTMLFPFFSASLGLSGYAKETFAVIFNFWFWGVQKPVSAPISIIQKITGGARPTIVDAIKTLEEQGLIHAQKSPGKRTLYTVQIEPHIMSRFLVEYAELVNRRDQHKGSSQVKRDNQHEFIHRTSTGSERKPHNIIETNTNDKSPKGGRVNIGRLKTVK